MHHPSDKFTWWQTGVIYQIYPRSFKDSNADGVGDLKGIIEKLDYLTWLGVDAIWINPIYPSPMADFGYDISDYTNINPVFGDLRTFDHLLSEAHRRGLRVILDFVPNHTSDQHPWFVESRSSRDNPRRDWYIWKDPKPDGSPPNNWVSMFGGPAWSWDKKTEQYYLHLFLDKQPDLNWRNPAVKAAMLDVLRFWLDRGVDGFRVDVVSFIVKDKLFRDNPVLPGITPRHPNDLWEQQEHVYDIDQPEVHEVIREFRSLLDSYGDRVLIGEVWTKPRSRWVQYYGENGDGLHLPFNFGLLFLPWQAEAIRASVDELEAMLPPGAWPNYVLGSHDVPRLATRFGEKAIRTAAMLLLTLRGTPTIYMGDEIGMRDGNIPFDRIQDPQGVNINPQRSRDPCRTPFQWSAEPHAGFSIVEPWLPIAEGYETVNVATQRDDPTSVLSLYHNLLSYRRQTPALTIGRYQSWNVDAACITYLREWDDQRRLIALNLSDHTRYLQLDHIAAYGRVVVSTQLDRIESVKLSRLELRPHEGVIIEI